MCVHTDDESALTVAVTVKPQKGLGQVREQGQGLGLGLELPLWVFGLHLILYVCGLAWARGDKEDIHGTLFEH